MRQQFPLDALVLDRDTGVPQHRQLYGQLRALILKRTLRAGSRLPSTRDLAKDLAIARNTVVAAYEQLATEGYLETRSGARARVADLLGVPRAGDRTPGSPPPPSPTGLSERGALMLQQPRHRSFPGRVAFHPGTPDVAQFPFAAWGRILARRARASGDDLFGYHHIAGYPPLREAIAGYLDASRGVRCTPDQIVVATGAQAALDLLARLLLDPGDTVWMEEPGYIGARSAFLAAGARLQPLTVGEHGWDLEAGVAPSPRLIYVTPSCQHPLGVTMRMEQRLRLLEIARRHDAWIVEDDFDSEYRFQGHPIPAMQGSDDTGRVIYVGTFAKTLFPALRLGFMVLPQSLGRRATQAINITGQFAPLMLQAALADFIDGGHFTKHLRRMRRLYAGRRDLFARLCRHHLGEWLTLGRSESGIQMVGLFRGQLDDRAVAAAAERRRINVAPLSIHYRRSPRNGLVMGYAAVNEPMVRAGLRTLREAFEEVAMCSVESLRRTM